MTEQDLRNLQIYIGKRNRNQTDEQVIEHIKKINNKTPLTQEEWHKLIFPSCNNGYIEILRFVLSNIESLNNIKEYMIHTVYGRNNKITEKRIEVLKELMKYLTDNREESLYRMVGLNIPFDSNNLNIIEVNDNDIINLLDSEIKVIATPGHTDGSVCYLYKNILFSGDTLFSNSIGRTDFPTGSIKMMKESLAKLSHLSNQIKVYPGHDLKTTIKDEKENNPYLKRS